MLLVANLVNKQAFYNQYWLSAALVAISLAVPARARAAADDDGDFGDDVGDVGVTSPTQVGRAAPTTAS